jgi:hypothetical protein
MAISPRISLKGCSDPTNQLWRHKIAALRSSVPEAMSLARMQHIGFK